MTTKKRTAPGRDPLELMDEWFPPDAEDLALREMFRRQRRIAELISTARREKGLTQTALADLIGTQRSAIARLERPDYKGYSLPTLEKVAAALGKEVVVQLVDPGTQVLFRTLTPRRTRKRPTRVVYHRSKERQLEPA